MNMDIIAKRIVKKYVEEHLDKTDITIKIEDKTPYIVWKCKTLQNWKYLMSTDLHDGMYYKDELLKLGFTKQEMDAFILDRYEELVKEKEEDEDD